ncbi:PIN domain-containing protein [Mycobacterium riyadhense]|uniref:Twitching motility protein PilT n=1 Tax=Mycobacterium riyadhense TaxID=486698 RepID=A0A1X2C9S3_9MYCO|nr:PIN domain-containing protein [Mycobacterium riyadhense]MCV7144671.1 PIN domain-containing protein [Mycobacterium riyadhense]ORW72571.1 twitching motility protein PilT [Mycobacterium riyadhense]
MDFVDTNVLLYAYDTAAGHRHDRAADLVGRLWQERSGAISVQVLQEFFVNATRKAAAPATLEAAVDRLRSLSRWRVHSPLADDVVAAASWSHRHQLPFRDAMIVRSAAELHCGILWSEDLNDGQLIEGVRVRNPFG